MPVSSSASRLSAVVRMPVPSGLVRTRQVAGAGAGIGEHPVGVRPRRSRAMPKSGSSESIECPPSTRQRGPLGHLAPRRPAPRPAARAAALSRGQPTRLSAKSGVPPIAYTSLSALAAAMAPQAPASSTIGVKKSTVATSARSSVRRNTAASSRVAASTSTRGSLIAGHVTQHLRSTRPGRACRRSPRRGTGR